MTTAYFLNLIMGNVFGSQASPTIPETYYLGLSSTTPNADGTGVTEPTGGGYGRATITSFTVPTDGTVSNAESVDFPIATADWGSPITHYVLYDAAGNVLLWDALVKERNIQSDTQFYFKPNALTFTLRSAS